MLLLELFREHPVKARRLKLAAGGRCEHCSNAFPLPVLMIHIIDPSAEVTSDSSDPETDVLVLCPECHRFFMSAPVERNLQRELVSYRSAEVRNTMRHILKSPTRTYVPPVKDDPEAIFREMFESGALDQCLNGG